jgi:hypothetical protein
MDTSNFISLSLNGTLNGEPISPSNISARVLLDFVEASAKFVSGKRKGWQNQTIEIAKGSFDARLPPPEGDLSIWEDLNALQSGHDELVSEGRRMTLHSIREIAQSVTDGSVLIRHNDALIYKIETQATPLSHGDDWYPVQRWMFGTIENAGGSQPKLRLRLRDGRKVGVLASAELQRQEVNNFVFHERLLHIAAEENFQTGELRAHQLIEFTVYEPNVSAEAMSSFVAAGTKAWSGVADPDAWLAELRGQ